MICKRAGCSKPASQTTYFASFCTPRHMEEYATGNCITVTHLDEIARLRAKIREINGVRA